MNRLLIAALAVVACVPLLARAATTADPVVPKGLSDAPMAEPTPLAETPPPPRPMKNEMAASHDADARQCLNFPSNRQIMACAERYRSHHARAKVAKVTPSDKPKEEVVKAADTSKSVAAAKAPDTSKGAPSAAPAATAAKPPAAPTKTSDVINLPPLKPVAAEPPKPAAAAPAKAPEPAKK